MAEVLTVDVHKQGHVLSSEIDYARAKIGAALQHAHYPVQFVRVRLTLMPDPAVSLPAVAQVNAELDGRLIRAQAAGNTVREAVDEVQDRLRRLVERASNDWEAIRGRTPERGPRWRGGGPSAAAARARTDAEPQIVRRKTYDYGRLTIEEAAADLEVLSYEFHVFTEHGTGVDSVISRRVDGSVYEIAQLQPPVDQLASGGLAVSVSPSTPPRLTEQQAASELTASGLPFLFFQHADTDRGCVLYHRYDGNYGLISAAASLGRTQSEGSDHERATGVRGD